MGAALTIFAVVSISILVVRIGAVAFQHTGFSEVTARFQAFSVFTGCGFTTSESETIVNYPVRRKIAATLMIIGNLGLVEVLSTLVVSFVAINGSTGEIMNQVIWLAGGLFMLWLLMCNKQIDQFMCAIIGEVLRRTTPLGQRDYHKLLQIADGHSVSEHFLTESHINELKVTDFLAGQGFQLLAIERLKSAVEVTGIVPRNLDVGDKLLLLGWNNRYEKFAQKSD